MIVYNQAAGQQEQAGLAQLDALAAARLLHILRALAVLPEGGRSLSRHQLTQQLNLAPHYQRLCAACLHILETAGYIHTTTTDITVCAGVGHAAPQDLERQQAALADHYPLLRPHLTLLTTCLQALPALLRGELLATEVLFPNSSLALVQAIYQGTFVTNYFNQLMGLAVKRTIEQRLPTLKQDEKFRIVEIGAGTGGTTGFVLAAIEAYGAHIDYLYSDLSPRFIHHGQHAYGSQYPWLRFGLLDLEKPLTSQGLARNQIDLVLGTNVVHATQNIQQTLQNLKAVLSANGLLLLNEVTRFSAFTTLTFGLLDGWWAFADGEQRIAHTPFLGAEQWARALQVAGFQAVQLGGKQTAVPTGQVILLAESDGLLRLPQMPASWRPGQTTPDRTRPSPAEPEQHAPKAASAPSVMLPQRAANAQQQGVEAAIIRIISEHLQIAAAHIEVDMPYTDLGVDSLLAVEIVNQINRQLQLTLRTTDLFNYVDIQSLSKHIIETLLAQQTHPVLQPQKVMPAVQAVEDLFVPQRLASNLLPDHPSTHSAPSQQASAAVQPPRAIAIIGMAGRFPGAEDPTHFWQNLAAGRNTIVDAAAARWTTSDFYSPDPTRPAKSRSRWAGLLTAIDQFDPLFFNISPREAECMDPQQRLFLQTAWAALEDAGYAGATLAGQTCGVFVGCSAGDYQQQLAAAGITDAYGFMGNAASILAARIAYHLNLKGPSIAIDTACSSSLVAIHLACESIRSGTSSMAVAGGVAILTTPTFHIQASQAGMLSVQGQCRTFAQGADGFVPAEAVGAIILKALPQALADGDQIYGVIQGSGLNQDGKTNGITAPNGPAQTALVSAVYTQFGIDPATISYVEAHGTGTILGDPIEVGALSDAFRQFTARQGYCAIGSVKTNIGHTLTAAGVVSVIKVLLAMKYKQLPPSLHFAQPNEHIDFANSPFYVNTELQDWQVATGPRRAAISSFGFSGTNAHLVLEEAPAQAASTDEVEAGAPQVIVLSAKDAERLRVYAGKLLAYVAPETPASARSTPRAAIQAAVQAQVAGVLGVDGAELEPAQSFAEWGLDAVQLAHLRALVEAAYSCEIPPHHFTAASSVAQIADHLAQPPTAPASTPPQPTLAQIAYTLQVGREALDARLAFVVASHAELCEQLRQYLAQTSTASQYDQGQSASPCRAGATDPALVQWLIEQRAYAQLAQLWVAGSDIDWRLLHGPTPPRRVALPTYPFAQQRYWIPATTAEHPQHTPSTAVPAAASVAAHKMVLLTKAWEIVEGAPANRAADQGRVALLATATTHTLAQALAARLPGARLLLPEAVRQMNAAEPGAWADWAGALDLTGLDPALSADHEESAIAWLQKLIEHSQQPTLRLIYVTALLEAFPGQPQQFAGAKQAALYRLLSSEYGKVHACHLDLDGSLAEPARLVTPILAEWQQADNTVQVCYRAGVRYRATLQERAGEQVIRRAAQTPTRYPTDQVLWITGGTRGIGMRCAHHFVKAHGVKKLVLLGREALPPRAAWARYLARPEAAPVLKQKISDVQALEASGAEVMVLTGSLTDRATMVQHKARVNQTMGPIFGVIHAAGLVNQTNPAFIRKSWAEIAAVCAPKVAGLTLLHELLASEPLHFFVLCSSVAAAVPTLSAGRSDYAMANAYMDYFAAEQQRQGHTYTISIQWPSWQATGMGLVESQAYQQSGLVSHTAAEGLTLLDAVLALKPGPVVLPAVVRAAQFQPNQLLRPRLTPPPPSLAVEPTSASMQGPSARYTRTAAWLRELLSQELKLPAERLAMTLPFQEYGVDSIMLAQLVTRIDQQLAGVALDPSVILTHPTMQSLTEYLIATYPAAVDARGEEATQSQADSENANITMASQPPKPQPSNVSRLRPSEAGTKVAVVGMACHFPDAPALQPYWRNLQQGRDSIREVPRARWAINQYYQPYARQTGKSISKWGAFLTGIEEFDPAYFGISPALASSIDPLARQWLEVSVEALADAGYSKADLWGQPVGVFVGTRVSNFASKVVDFPKDALIGLGQNFIAAHLAHLYNFKGPNLVVDTACASALTAMHLAIQSINSGESIVALAGGVDILLDETPFLSLSAAQILSPDGRCKPFDEQANGIGLGEGCGVLILKSLDQAMADGNKIYGVIEGSAINQDGYTMGVTTPNPEAQQALIEAALCKAQVAPRTITYVETHGTGTLIGDPIELRGLTNVFQQATSDRQFCGVGSVKSNLGHLLSAAGAASMIKVLLAMTHEALPPTLHCHHPNPRFNFAESPFYPVRHFTAWPGVAGIHRAGVSAFGLGGHNAHLIVSDAGIPHGQRATLTPRGAPIVFNRKRYWPQQLLPPFSNGASDAVSQENLFAEALSKFFAEEKIG